MHLFYAPDIEGKSYVLPEEESKHAVRVLRLKRGDAVVLVNGKGGWYEGEIAEDHPKKCLVNIVAERQESPGDTYVHIAVAPTKNMERMEWFVEKATEIGIDEITMLKCRNSERDIVKTERLEKVAVSAMKQSLKTFLPKLNPLVSPEQFAKELVNVKDGKFIAHCAGSDRKKLKELCSNSRNIVMIGPEGDFTGEEIAEANRNGFISVSLGKSRLRTETAALVACHTIQILNE